MKGIGDLYGLLEPLASQAECQTCRLCEEHVGLVYLLGDEAGKARKYDIPVLATSQDAQYLGRTREGWCCSFDPASNMCRIYEDRPLCCRIYPLDLMKIDDQVWWVIHAECPIAQRFQRERKLSILAAMTWAMESKISFANYRQWLVQDRFSQMVEAFSFDESKVLKLRLYGEKLPFP